MPLSDAMTAAVAKSKGLPNQGPAKLLALYGLFKQATKGDATGKRPGMLDPRGRAKFDAWAGHKGMSAVDAETAYATLVDSLAPTA